jgi:hypothetical protein
MGGGVSGEGKGGHDVCLDARMRRGGDILRPRRAMCEFGRVTSDERIRQGFEHANIVPSQEDTSCGGRDPGTTKLTIRRSLIFIACVRRSENRTMSGVLKRCPSSPESDVYAIRRSTRSMKTTADFFFFLSANHPLRGAARRRRSMCRPWRSFPYTTVFIDIRHCRRRHGGGFFSRSGVENPPGGTFVFGVPPSMQDGSAIAMTTIAMTIATTTTIRTSSIG